VRRDAAGVALVLLVLLIATEARAKESKRSAMLHRIFDYAATVDTSAYRGVSTYAYTKSLLRVEKRNALLMAVPTMYTVAHGGAREYFTESYNKIDFTAYGKYTTTRIAQFTTIPHRKQAMEVSLLYLTPEIYNVTIFQGNVLSPFNRENRIFYKYSIKDWNNGRALVVAKPKLNNTQLIEATAYVNTETGQILEVDLRGEYDMINVLLSMNMCTDKSKSLLPSYVHLSTRFSLLGNKIHGDYSALYNLEGTAIDSTEARGDSMLLARLRPIALSQTEREIMEQHLLKQIHPTKKQREKTKSKAKLWDALGEHLVSRHKQQFGRDGQGMLRISPLLNPEVLGYSHRKGITYKMDVRTAYRVSDDMDFSVRAKLGYSFKQHQFYYNIPATLFWSRRHNAYTEFELSNGNQIRSYTLEDETKSLLPDTMNFGSYDLHTYKDHWLKVSTHYDLNRHFSVEAGLIGHQRTAVDKASFDHFGLRHSYTSVAPLLELSIRPLGYSGPVVVFDYERSFKGLCGADIDYERWEIDGQWLLRMRHLKSFSMRLGTGFYTQKGHSWQFLDYSNFRENNLVNGWNDDWSGEFELLNREVYNTSPYYVRGNLTYESPLLALSWLPQLGHFIEMERIYASVLKVSNLDIYTEAGYGFTTRAFSMGAFISNQNGRFKDIGFKFGLELFHDW